jgi:hypothetical protein
MEHGVWYRVGGDSWPGPGYDFLHSIQTTGDSGHGCTCAHERSCEDALLENTLLDL